MPNLPAHIHLALKAAPRIGDGLLDNYLGDYLLGATTPDIRIITKQSRETYHFSSLDFRDIGAGAEGLFEAHPGLRDTADPATRALVAGYLSHLYADEVWIVTMFRPYFAGTSAFADNTEAMVMDRVLQLALDREAFAVPEFRPGMLTERSGAVELPFLSQDTLAEWRTWVVEFLESGFSWDRLRFMARRISRGDESHPAHLIAAGFVDGLPESLDRLYATLPAGEPARYTTEAVDTIVENVGAYLS